MIKRSVRCLKKEILNSDIYKEYSSLKLQIETSLHLKALKKEINELKQLMTNNINNESHNEYKKQYLAKLEEYDNNPLIQNFNYIKEEFSDELNLIKERIEP